MVCIRTNPEHVILMAVLVYRDNISRMSYCITIIGKEQDPV